MVEFTLDTQRIEAEDFAEQYLRAIGAEVVVAGEDFRFGHKRRGDLDAAARSRLRRATGAAARGRVLVGDPPPAPRGPTWTRPLHCSAGHPRSTGSSSRATRAAARSAFPTANVAADPVLLVPLHGIYAGLRQAGSPRARSRSATNPHYGGDELRIEAFLLGFAGDLYGKRLVVELWQRLRDEGCSTASRR